MSRHHPRAVLQQEKPRMQEMIRYTSEEIKAIEQRFVDSLERELRIQGEYTDAAIAIINSEVRAKLLVRDRTQKHEIGVIGKALWNTPHGLLNPTQAAAQIVETVQKRSFGPNPFDIVVERLVSLGVPESKAIARATNRIDRRLPDGAVVLLDPQTERVVFGPPVLRDRRGGDGVLREYTPEELAEHRDHRQAVTRLTREILAEVDQEAKNPRLPLRSGIETPNPRASF